MKTFGSLILTYIKECFFSLNHFCCEFVGIINSYTKYNKIKELVTKRKKSDVMIKLCLLRGSLGYIILQVKCINSQIKTKYVWTKQFSIRLQFLSEFYKTTIFWLFLAHFIYFLVFSNKKYCFHTMNNIKICYFL